MRCIKINTGRHWIMIPDTVVHGLGILHGTNGVDDSFVYVGTSRIIK